MPLPSAPADTAPWRDKLTLLLESTGDGIFGIDLDGRCIFINRAAAAMLGLDAAATLGRNMHDLVHHSHADGSHYAETDCPIFRAFRKGEPCRVDSEVFWRADGRAFEVEYSSYPILDAGQVQGAVITFLDITERRRAEELLRRANDELESRVDARTGELSAALARLRELAAHAHSVREEERKRIAREVHDELGSLLVALKLDVTWLQRRIGDREDLQFKCRSMARLIEGAVENVGRIITDLRPSILDHQGLIAALEWQIAEFRDATELQCDSRIHIAAGVAPPDGAAASAVFRIFQELLSNVARHAGATQVEIIVTLEAEMLSITVRDDGRGATMAAFDRPGSFGVLGMRERARHLGGDLRITSQPGAGTRVSLNVPLTAAMAQADDPLAAV
ncbi:MAG: PAS domain S-box protein [Burkholderiales bacterium]|nr:PAS domain S-box protein [Burkholderiales bacterium]